MQALQEWLSFGSVYSCHSRFNSLPPFVLFVAYVLVVTLDFSLIVTHLIYFATLKLIAPNE